MKRNVAGRMTALETVENTRQTSIDVVFGYLRLHMGRLNIPKGIKLICLKYYCDIEWFSGFKEDSFKVSNDKMTITTYSKNWNMNIHTIFGNVWIPSTSKTISKWTLKINQMRLGVCVGFASKYDIYSDFCGDKENVPNYAVSCDGWLSRNGKRIGDAGRQFNEGNEVTLTLDLTKAQIRIKSDILSESVIFDKVAINENIRYIFAMQMILKDDSVTLTHFEMST